MTQCHPICGHICCRSTAWSPAEYCCASISCPAKPATGTRMNCTCSRWTLGRMRQGSAYASEFEVATKMLRIDLENTPARSLEESYEQRKDEDLLIPRFLYRWRLPRLLQIRKFGKRFVFLKHQEIRTNLETVAKSVVNSIRLYFSSSIFDL